MKKRKQRLKNSASIQGIMRVAGFAALMMGLFLVSGCSMKPERSAPGAEETLFRPPTIAPTPLPTSTPAKPLEVATKASECTDLLTYVKDTTIQDGTVVLAGVTLDKRWEVKNSGTCNWDDRYHIRWIAGSKIGAEADQELAPARSDTTVEIRMVLNAPTKPGKYRSAWQAINPQGKLFGDPFYIDFIVQAPTP